MLPGRFRVPADLRAGISLCLLAIVLQACALTEPPQGRIDAPGPWPELGRMKQEAEPEGRLMTPEEREEAIRRLKEREV